MRKLLKLFLFALLSIPLYSQVIINQEYVQQWQAQPASPGLPVYNNCYLYLDQTTHLLIGINADGTYCLTPGGGGGGTGVNPGTPYQVTRYNAAGTNIEDSTGFDNPANGPTEWVNGLSVENNAGYRAFTNSPTGTSTNLLVCLDSTVTTLAEVTTCAVSSTSVLGLADNGAGSTGTVRVAMFGFHSCVFDNQTVIGDWVVPSTSVAGDCSDAGSTKPSGVQVLGHATSLNTGAATLGTVDLFTGDTIAPGGGGNPVTVNPCVQIGCDAYYVLTNVVGGDPNTNDDGNGNKQSKSVGLTDASQSGFWYSQAGPALPTLDGLNRFYFSINSAFGTTYGLEPWDNIPTAGHCVDLAAGDAAGWIKLHDSGAACGAGAGSVTNFTAGNLSPLFTTSVATSTTTPALSFVLSNAAANTVFGNFTGSSGAPSYNAVSACGDATHALKWTAGTGFGCQTISVGSSTEVQVNGVDTTSQTPINFLNSSTVLFTNPSAGVIQAAVAPAAQASNPTAPTLTPNTPGSTAYSYAVVGCEDVNCAYHSAMSGVTSTSTGNANLATGTMKLTAYADTLYGYRFYKICRTASSGTPASIGVIATGVGKQFIDNGIVGDGTTCSSTYASNTTVLDQHCLASSLPAALNVMPGAPCGVDAPPTSPNALDDEFTEQFGVPADANNPEYSWVQQGTTTATFSGGELIYTPQAVNTQNVARLLCLPTYPSTPYTFVATVSTVSGGAGAESGIGVTDGTKLLSWAHGSNSIDVGHWTNINNNFSSAPINITITHDQGLWVYLKLQDNGTNIIYSHSFDGVNYLQDLSEGRTSFLTPAKFCLYGQSSTTFNPQLSYDYLRRTQ